MQFSNEASYCTLTLYCLAWFTQHVQGDTHDLEGRRFVTVLVSDVGLQIPLVRATEWTVGTLVVLLGLVTLKMTLVVVTHTELFATHRAGPDLAPCKAANPSQPLCLAHPFYTP